jgi:hypothetical protein
MGMYNFYHYSTAVGGGMRERESVQGRVDYLAMAFTVLSMQQAANTLGNPKEAHQQYEHLRGSRKQA